jgi:hypothetical protein
MKNLKLPLSFFLISFFLLLWNSMGVYAFFYDLMLSAEDLALLPVEHQELYARFPWWTRIFYGIAVFGGFLGCVFLLLKKKMSYLLFQISFVGIVVQISYSIFAAKSIEVYGAQGLVMPIMIVGFGVFILWYSNRAIEKSWLN